MFMVIVVVVIVVVVLYYLSIVQHGTTIQPQPTLQPLYTVPTTSFLLTEQAILMTLTPPSQQPYTTQYSQAIFDRIFQSQQNSAVLDKIGVKNPSIDCYVLYTNTFSGLNDPKEYDIIGAYFILQLKNYIGQDLLGTCFYYDSIKKVLIPTDVQKLIIDRFQSNPAITFAGTLMDMDNFVPRLSKYLYLNYQSTFNIDYISLKNTSCK